MSSYDFYLDNDSGGYWHDLYQRLQRAKVQEATMTAWVNPDRPGQAYLDRTLRSGVMLFGLTLGGAFALAGWIIFRSVRR